MSAHRRVVFTPLARLLLFRGATSQSRGASTALQNSSALSHASSSYPFDTLALVRQLEAGGFTSKQSEGLVRCMVESFERAVRDHPHRGEMERETMTTRMMHETLKTEIMSHHREEAKNNLHQSTALLSECEKIRAEMRYNIEKLTSSQKLDLNLEKGRIRDELQAQDNKVTQTELRLDREINGMRTNIEATKNEIIKYSVGTLVSMATVSLAVMRLLM